MDIFRGDLTDISALTETLVSNVCTALRPGGAHVHNNTPRRAEGGGGELSDFCFCANVAMEFGIRRSHKYVYFVIKSKCVSGQPTRFSSVTRSLILSRAGQCFPFSRIIG